MTVVIVLGAIRQDDAIGTDVDDVERRITVIARQNIQAEIETVKGVGYHMLICGFAFDSAVYEDAKRYSAMEARILCMNSAVVRHVYFMGNEQRLRLSETRSMTKWMIVVQCPDYAF